MGELLAPPELHGLWVGILQQDQKPLPEAEWVDDIENSNNTFPLYKKLAFSPRPDFPLCFHFQVSQPGHCWHLRPDNSVVGSVLCNVKSSATSLASACWVPVVSPFPPTPPPKLWQQPEMSPGSQNYPRLWITVYWLQFESGEPRVITSSFTREKTWKGERTVSRALIDTLWAEDSESSLPCAISK